MKIYGTATVGTKGQIVIPADARAVINLKTGDKVLITGIDGKPFIGLCPLQSLDALLAAQRKQLEHLQSILNDQEETK